MQPRPLLELLCLSFYHLNVTVSSKLQETNGWTEIDKDVQRMLYFHFLYHKQQHLQI